LSDALTAAKLSNTVFATQPIQHNAYFLLRTVLLTCLASDAFLAFLAADGSMPEINSALASVRIVLASDNEVSEKEPKLICFAFLQ
jgi:hypothetical protein